MNNTVDKLNSLNKREFRRFVPSNDEELKYYEALKKVKRIKGFYTHAIVFVVINIFIIIANINELKEGESYFQLKNFYTLLFWGMGLIAHGLSVFLPDFMLEKTGKNEKLKN